MKCWAGCLRVAGCAVLAWAAGVAGTANAAVQELPGAMGQMLQWVKATGDPGGLPFAIVDKKEARIHVFTAQGRLVGTSVALLGATRGDHTVAGVGERAQRGAVRPDERTTPAGRFQAQPGTNLGGEHVVWADYASAFAIHRLRPGRSHAPRLQRLGTPTPHDNRMSLGCVIVPAAFYTQVVQRVLGAGRSVVYVLPEMRTLADTFSGL